MQRNRWKVWSSIPISMLAAYGISFLQDIPFLIGAMAWCLAFLFFACWLWLKATTTILLCVSLLGFSVHTRKAKASGEAVVVLVIIVISTYVVLRINRECQKKFGNVNPLTNAAPDELFSQPAYAASYRYIPIVYSTCEDVCTNSISINLTATVSSSPHLSANVLAQTVNAADYSVAIATYGINLYAPQSFARDGQTITAAQSPIRFDASGKVVTITPPTSQVMVTNYLESSFNGGRTWQRMFAVVAKEGSTIQVEDDSVSTTKLYRLVKP